MNFPQHRRFVGCDVDSEYFASCLPELVLISARPDLKEKSNTNEVEYVQRAAFIFFEVIEELGLKRRIDV